MNNSPTVSVVMSCYNEPLVWIQESIDSILSQTFSDFEFIIINDNPNRKELKEFLNNITQKDHRIKLINNEKNIGLTKSLNLGLRKAKGKYIARMDADDISLPNRFEKQVSYLNQNKQVVILGSWVKSFGSRKNTVKFPENDTDIRKYQIIASPFDHPATMMRKSSILKVGGGYDESIRYAQDQEFWYRLGKVGLFYNIQEVLFKHRYSENQISKKHVIEQQKNVKKIRKYLMEDYFSSLKLSGPSLENINIEDIYLLDSNLDGISLSETEQKMGYAIIQSLLMSQSSYSISNLCKNIILGKVFKWRMSIKQIIKYIIKTIFPEKFITNGIR